MARPRRTTGPRPAGKVSTSFRIDGAVLEILDRLAVETGQDRSHIVETLIRERGEAVTLEAVISELAGVKERLARLEKSDA